MTLQISNGKRLNLADAILSEENILQRLQRRTRMTEMYQHLWDRRSQIQAITAQHLGLRHESQCGVRHYRKWARGGFNICAHVEVTDNHGEVSRKIFRCPMPHKAGDQQRVPDSVDEKVRSEVANYAWIERHCPDVPIPRLHGFGLANDTRFTHQRHLPWYHRCAVRFYHFLRSIFQRQSWSPYVPCRSGPSLGTAYILMDFISDGTTLHQTWKQFKEDKDKRERLLQGLGRVMLSLARLPQPRIGSLRFNDNGTVSLTNRPLLCANTLLESVGIPKMQGLYSSTSDYLLALLDLRATTLEFQPNAAHNEDDCRLQMSHVVLLRSILHQIPDVHYSGPSSCSSPISTRATSSSTPTGTSPASSTWSTCPPCLRVWSRYVHDRSYRS